MDTSSAPEPTPLQIEAALLQDPERHNLTHADQLRVPLGRISRARNWLVQARRIHHYTGDTSPLGHAGDCWCRPTPDTGPTERWALVVWRGHHLTTTISHYASRAQAQDAMPDDDGVIDADIINVAARPTRRHLDIDQVIAAGQRKPPDDAKRDHND